MRIAVAGCGFVGVVHGAVLAEHDHRVQVYDTDGAKILGLNEVCRGETEKFHIHEKGLPALLRKGYESTNLYFTDNRVRAIRDSEVIFIAVGTPSMEDLRANLESTEAVAHEIGQIMAERLDDYKLIVTKSTVPVGTGDRLEEILGNYSHNFDVVSNPETLAEGRAVRDASRPDRIIVGTDSEHARKIMFDLYSRFFFPGQERIHFMSRRGAELTKYACNGYLAQQLTFTNAMANLAKKVGADWREMLPAIMADARIGKFVHPGSGYGGSCLGKDTAQLQRTMEDFGSPPEDIALVASSRAQNEAQRGVMNRMVEERYGSDLTGKTFAIWGLSFKKDSNDVRDAASLAIVPYLLSHGAAVRAHDPEARSEFSQALREMDVDRANLTLVDNKYDATNGADALLITND